MATTDTQQSANSRLPSQIVTATALGVKIAIAALTKQSVNIEQYTTLNEAHEVLATESLGSKTGTDFKLQYFGIGIKGSQYLGTDSNGITKLLVNQHQPTDANAFFPIPHVVREITNDLTSAERENFRLRTVFTKNNIVYVAYWLKLVGFGSFTPTIKTVTKNATTGNEDPADYIPQEDSLHPTPITPNADGTVPISDKYVAATAKLDLSLSAADLAEIKNACSILHDDTSYAAVNEYYVATGIESQNDGQTSGTDTVKYSEVKSAVICYHLTETHARDANSNGAIPLFFDIGAAAPLLVAQ